MEGKVSFFPLEYRPFSFSFGNDYSIPMFSEILGTEGIILPEARKRIENFPLGNAILEIYYSYNADIRRCVLFDQFNIRDTKLERRKDLVDRSIYFLLKGDTFLLLRGGRKRNFHERFLPQRDPSSRKNY